MVKRGLSHFIFLFVFPCPFWWWLIWTADTYQLSAVSCVCWVIKKMYIWLVLFLSPYLGEGRVQHRMNIAKPFVLYFRFVTQNNWCSSRSTGGDGVYPWKWGGTGNFSWKTVRRQTLLVRSRHMWDDIKIDDITLDLKKLDVDCIHPAVLCPCEHCARQSCLHFLPE